MTSSHCLRVLTKAGMSSRQGCLDDPGPISTDNGEASSQRTFRGTEYICARTFEAQLPPFFCVCIRPTTTRVLELCSQFLGNQIERVEMRGGFVFHKREHVQVQQVRVCVVVMQVARVLAWREKEFLLDCLIYLPYPCLACNQSCSYARRLTEISPDRLLHHRARTEKGLVRLLRQRHGLHPDAGCSRRGQSQ